MLKKISLLTFLIFFVCNLLGQDKILSISTKLSTNKVLVDGNFQGAVKVHIKHPWHINSWKPSDEFSIPTILTIDESEHYTILDISYPQHKLIDLNISDTPLALYEGDITIIVKGKLNNPSTDNLLVTGKLNFQGCNITSCLPPNSADVIFEITTTNNAKSIKKINQATFNKKTMQNNSESLVEEVEEVANKQFNVSDSFKSKGIFLTLILIFFGGIALNLTPCIYPLIPITISYFGGQVSNNKGKTIALALLYVLGMAIVNSSIGTIVAMSGGLLGTFMTNPYVLVFIASMLIALALSMFGVYEFGLPPFLSSMSGGAKSGYLGAIAMGMTMGIVAAPCIGPFVISLLTFVATTGNPFIGFSLFFTLSIGIGLPFVFLAFFSGKISSLPKAGDWMVGIRTIFGIILIGMALYFLSPIIPKNIFVIILPSFLAISGIYLLIINKSGDSTKIFSVIKRLLAILAIFAAGFLTKPNNNENSIKMDWQKFTPELYESAINGNTPVILDFYADWCIPCKELDKFTFTDKNIIQLSKDFTLIKIDLTSGSKGKIEELRDKYKVKGVPTIVFINDVGKELKSLRTLGYEEPETFVKKMKNTLNK